MQLKVVLMFLTRASSDKSVHGYKKQLLEKAAETRAMLDLVIKNTYRTLIQE
jgi:hypothetical protein